MKYRIIFCLFIYLFSCKSSKEKDPSINEKIKDKYSAVNQKLLNKPKLSRLTHSKRFESSKESNNRVHYIYAKGQEAFEKKDYVLATNFYRKAYQLINTIDSLEARVTICQQYALALTYVKQYEKSVKMFDEAIFYEKKKYVASRLPYLYYYQGVVYYLLNQLDKAQSSWQLCVKSATYFDDIRYLLNAEKKLKEIFNKNNKVK